MRETVMQRNAIAAILAVVLGFAPAAWAGGGKTINADYAGRDYVLYKPASLAARPPLLLVLHGGGGNANWMTRHLDMNAMADRYGFMVAYLNGTGTGSLLLNNLRTWNAGSCCGPAVKTQSDDKGYIIGFIQLMAQQQNIDSARVYLTGHSNGAMMSYRMACEMRDKIAGIVAISGTVGVDRCSAPALPVLHIHGTQDPNVPMQGGKGKLRQTKDVVFRSLAENAAMLQAAGARYTLLLVPEAEHKLTSIDETLEKTTGRTLPETIARFLFEQH